MQLSHWACLNREFALSGHSLIYFQLHYTVFWAFWYIRLLLMLSSESHSFRRFFSAGCHNHLDSLNSEEQRAWNILRKLSWRFVSSSNSSGTTLKPQEHAYEGFLYILVSQLPHLESLCGPKCEWSIATPDEDQVTPHSTNTYKQVYLIIWGLFQQYWKHSGKVTNSWPNLSKSHHVRSLGENTKTSSITLRGTEKVCVHVKKRRNMSKR